MEPFKIIIPEIEAFNNMSDTIYRCLNDAGELSSELKGKVDNFASDADSFTAEADNFLQKIKTEQEKIDAEIQKKEAEYQNYLHKKQECQAVLLRLDNMADVIDGEKMAVSDEVNALYDNSEDGESPDLSEQKEHISELDRQMLQLSEDRMRVNEKISDCDEKIAEKKNEMDMLSQTRDRLAAKEDSIRKKYLEFMNRYRLMIGEVHDKGLLDVNNDIYNDAANTAGTLRIIFEQLRDIN